MLKISVIQESDQTIRLEVEGSLVGPWVDELRQQSDDGLLRSKNLTLDLERLRFIDSAGVALLRDLTVRGVAQLNRSTFISQQLKEATL